MANTNLIQTKLPQDLREKAAHFQINDNLIETISDIIELILRSRSMDKDSDKQSWFNLLPLMNDEQTAKLKDILMREKEKLAEIEKKYEDKKTDIKEKFVKKFEEGQYVERMQSIKAQEAAHNKEEDAEADALLQQL